MAKDWLKTMAKAAAAEIAKVDAAAKRTAEDGAKIVRDYAQDLVPVVTGGLQRSIIATDAAMTKDGAVAQAGSDVEYADEVEGVAPWDDPTVEAPPHPFLSPAADLATQKIRRQAPDQLKRALK